MDAPGKPTVAEAAAYLATYGVKEKLEQALNDAVQARSTDPLAFIAAALVTPTAPVPTTSNGKFFLGCAGPISNPSL